MRRSTIGRLAAFACLWQACAVLTIGAQEAGKPAPPVAAPPKLVAAKNFPAQIELLETHIRFEENGDSRKEVHTVVKINSELGVRQFARLTFDYNRGFQQVEFPFVRITHASGGTADILPSAIADAPHPAAVDYPAYHDVRVKSARILGLAPGDKLEYRVITTTTRHPLAPDFYLVHDFAKEGLATEEIFEIDVPKNKLVKTWTSAGAESYEALPVGGAGSSRTLLRWHRHTSDSSADSKKPSADVSGDLPVLSENDVVLSSFTWPQLVMALQKHFEVSGFPAAEILAKATALAGGLTSDEDKLRSLYEFVSGKIATVDLPIGATGFRLGAPEKALAAGYATPEEKARLLASLAGAIGLDAKPAFTGPEPGAERGPASPALLSNVLIAARLGRKTLWLDPAVEVAPYGMIASKLRGRPALLLDPRGDLPLIETIPLDLPFHSIQKVVVDASLTSAGTLKAKVQYMMRGDGELLLRVAFHQSPKEKWKEVAQLLALSDGFRGQITNATASDPLTTREAFTVEYEIEQPQLVDWSKSPVRIPALLPQLGLPELPAKTPGGPAATIIELGTPLDVEEQLTLRLPAGTTGTAPTGTSVDRDYAAFTSHYGSAPGTITAARRIKFLARELPIARSVDYNAFVHAVQNDQAQLFIITAPKAPARPLPQTPSVGLHAPPAP